ncbi:MAG: radical SAM protein [Candidatus Pacearchaeota archaeon]
MKLLLINPPQSAVYGKIGSPDYPPLGLAYIGAVLEKQGHYVRIIDIDAEKISKQHLLKIIRNFEIIGITATTPTFQQAEKLFKLIKENTKAITLLGGVHATITPEDCLKTDLIDFVIRGEGELTIVELLDAIEKKKQISSIKGISYKKNNKIIHNKDRELIQNLDDIPFPARHLFNQQKYTYPDSLLNPVMPIMTSRGCPHMCTYCCTKLIFSRRVRFRSAKNVVDEIQQLIRDYKVKEIHFWDDNFTLNKQRVFEILAEIKKRKIKLKFAFPNGLRVDQVDEEILRALKEMGVYSVAFGVESGNQIILNNVKKGTTIEKIEKAYKLAKKLKIETWGFFMLGLYGENKKTIRDTINFAKKLNPDIAKFHILKPYPGTEIFDQLKKDGLIIEFDYSKYGIHTPPVHRLNDITPDELIDLSKKAYREFYLRPSKIIQQITRIKSFQRFKLNLKTGINVLKMIK